MRKTKTKNLNSKNKIGWRPTPEGIIQMTTTTNSSSVASLNLTIDTRKKVIAMTKKFAKASRRVGSPEYDMLQLVRRDYPTYRVETKTTKAKANSLKGLNYHFMEIYIKKHAEDKLEDFNVQTAKLDGIKNASYLEVKAWFLNTFPEIEEYNTLRDALMAA